MFPVQCWWISIISFDGVAVDFVAGDGFGLIPCGFRLLGGGFRGFRLLAGPVTQLPVE